MAHMPYMTSKKVIYDGIYFVYLQIRNIEGIHTKYTRFRASYKLLYTKYIQYHISYMNDILAITNKYISAYIRYMWLYIRYIMATYFWKKYDGHISNMKSYTTFSEN